MSKQSPRTNWTKLEAAQKRFEIAHKEMERTFRTYERAAKRRTVALEGLDAAHAEVNREKQ